MFGVFVKDSTNKDSATSVEKGLENHHQICAQIHLICMKPIRFGKKKILVGRQLQQHSGKAKVVRIVCLGGDGQQHRGKAKVVCIVYLGGDGKMTFAREFFNHERSDYFQCAFCLTL